MNFRSDIQALRAVAVVLVLVYHIWPRFLPGGFVGVDVFFVVSGFLISSLLLREVATTGRVDFPKFYARRAVRLLPASLLVLVVVLIATVLLWARHDWVDVGSNIIAASFYAENWWLHLRAGDYLAGAGAANPVQHFWSLSLEEQFYFAWPLLIFSIFTLTRRSGADNWRRNVAIFFSAIVAASFTYSVWATYSGVASGGYFSTFSRAWQLGIGGLLALLPAGGRNSGRLAGIVVAAIVLIATVAVVVDNDFSYPGWVALVPTLAAAAFVAFGVGAERHVLLRWMEMPAVQWLGAISYSLYLWHWPIIVFFEKAFPGERGLLVGSCLAVVSLLFAHVSKHWIEDAFRYRKESQVSAWSVLARFSLAAMLVALMAIGIIWVARSGSDATGEFPGAAALRTGSTGNSEIEHFLPALVNVEGDVAPAYAQGCIQQVESSELLYCVYGGDDAPIKIAVVGDSHAVHWFPAFEEIAKKYDVQVIGVTKTSCPFADALVIHTGIKREYTSCIEWGNNVVAELISRKVDYVVISQSPKYMVASSPKDADFAARGPLSDGMMRFWKQLQAAGLIVRPIRSTPWQSVVMRDCAANQPWPFGECAGREDEVLSNSAIVVAATKVGIDLVDMTDQFCISGLCPAVIGDVFVYRDNAHIGATYARTLAPMLLERLHIDGVKRRTTALESRPPPVLPPVEGLQPRVASARFDRGEAFSQGCLHQIGKEVASCWYGESTPRLKVALVGDGMAANLVPGLIEAGKLGGWSVNTFLKDSCLFSAGLVYSRAAGGDFVECQEWSHSVKKMLDDQKPDLVLIVQSPIYRSAGTLSPDASRKELVDGVVQMWGQVESSGTQVVAFDYTPVMGVDVPKCLMDVKQRLSGCYAYTSASIRNGVLNDASARLGKRMININDEFCSEEYCPPQIRGTIIYRDTMQPTATFVRQLAPRLRSEVESTVAPKMR